MEKKHIITLGGLPGSGKSTAKKIIADKLGYETFSTGDFVREEAVRRGLTLASFNELIATDKALDELIDAELIRIEKEHDRIVIDSHLAFHFVPSAFTVYLDIPVATAAARIFNDRDSALRKKSGDSAATLEEAVAQTKTRIQNHQERYMRHYGISPYEAAHYDYVIDAAAHSPEEVAAQVLAAYEKWLSE